MKTTLTALLALLVACAFAQNENINWHFGSGFSMDFSGMTPNITTSTIQANNNTKPSVISDIDGNLLMYTDGLSVYDANGDVMPNGEFATLKLQTLIIPIPNEPTLYYVVRSDQSGTDYSLVDMALNDGMGDLVIDEKEVFLDSFFGRLMSTRTDTGLGRWLISAENNNGQNDDVVIKVYEVTPTGLDLNYENDWYYLWAGWEPQLDDAVISPDCSKIACSFKGHYMAFFEFDIETGEISNFISESVDANTSFIDVTELAFGPNSQYLYSLGDQSTLQQWDVSDFNINAINSSQSSVNTNGSQLTDIKLGPDGKLYIHDRGNLEIDVLNSPELPSNQVDFENAVFTELGGLSFYFPNTSNFICGFAPFFSFAPQNYCIGDTAFFDLNYNINPDSVFWDLGDPGSELDQSTQLSTSYVYPASGTYDVSTTVWLDGEMFPLFGQVNVYDYPEVDLGPDQTICEGESVQLFAGEALNYDWTPSGNGAVIDVTTSGIYSVTASNAQCIDQDTVEIVVIPFPDVQLGQDLFLCDPEPYTITSDFDGSWNTGETGSEITINTSGTYSQTVTNECFTVSDDITIQYVELPTSLLPNQLQACFGDTLELDTQLDAELVDFSWNTSESTPSIEVVETGVYVVSMEYLGCPFEDQTEVEFFEFIPLESILMPNIFTPNGDAENELFQPFSRDFPWLDPCDFPNVEVSMEIYNRWGNTVLEDECRWNGKAENGNEMNEGVYYYIV
ncbi:MAG: gliding motility-associated C-terminal domain-containing protein, partial [Bacteroidota bacterium]